MSDTDANASNDPMNELEQKIKTNPFYIKGSNITDADRTKYDSDLYKNVKDMLTSLLNPDGIYNKYTNIVNNIINPLIYGYIKIEVENIIDNQSSDSAMQSKVDETIKKYTDMITNLNVKLNLNIFNLSNINNILSSENLKPLQQSVNTVVDKIMLSMRITMLDKIHFKHMQKIIFEDILKIVLE
jgi:hypothetical protein